MIGKHSIAVDIPVLQINELIGGLSTKTDDISVVMEKAAVDSGDDSFKTCAFDEWLCVLKGRITCKIMSAPNGDVEVGPGETIFIAKNSTWKPRSRKPQVHSCMQASIQLDRVKMVDTKRYL